MIVVASVPSAHTYVHNALPHTGAIRVLADPVPMGASIPGQWWPPRFLDSNFLSECIGDIDIVHVHFGFESYSVDQLRDFIRVVREHHRALVLTVHDLHNPHIADNTHHLAQLDLLVPEADALVTLTTGAADDIETRWHRRPTVVAHPHVLPLHRVGHLRGDGRRENRRPIIGVHAKSIRANMDPEGVLPAVVAVAESIDAVVRLDIDDNLFDSAGNASGAPERLLEYRHHPHLDVRVHPRFSDDQFAEYLSDIDVAVLPYRFGTHSGWMEACRDAGTQVVVPDVGHFAQQFDCAVYRFADRGVNAESMRNALVAALERCDVPFDGSAMREFRRVQGEAIRSAHQELYSRVVVDRVGMSV